MNEIRNWAKAAVLVFIFSSGFYFSIEAQDTSNAGFKIREAYIQKYKALAIREMVEYGIPASIKLAQAVLESGAGNGELAKIANNHFGIKCHKEWTGDKFFKDDDSVKECFRKYESVEESYRDHSLFLRSRERYSNLFRFDICDYKAWAYGLKNAGYATNPAYPQLLIKIIEEHQLTRYDHPGSDTLQLANIETDSSIARGGTADNNLTSERGPVDVSPVKITKEGRKIYKNNDSKYIIYRQDDTPIRIAQEFDLYTWQIYDFNDLELDNPIKPGDMVYIEKKKRKASEEFYIVKPGDDMHAISQKFGIRLQNLYELNRMNFGTEPQQGDTLWLNKKKPADMQNRSPGILRIFLFSAMQHPKNFYKQFGTVRPAPHPC
ncbi:MAG: glucosaminidase domain-containing protein [Bacteroidales bacterium]|jgi:LysM repeat protein|nr:glucosaminidase domain-containing protein [Bacteroidales bacterium]MBP9512345.1 glucosaminidase domain-containing protein [Bacteroidales bacterium]MBP9588954.1 glucosaminidase domain-containing protein [Bacteroidales bacterium]